MFMRLNDSCKRLVAYEGYVEGFEAQLTLTQQVSLYHCD